MDEGHPHLGLAARQASLKAQGLQGARQPLLRYIDSKSHGKTMATNRVHISVACFARQVYVT